MRHKKKVFKVGRPEGHRGCMMSNMLASLFLNGRMVTTVAKGKELRRKADKMITYAKAGDLHRRRLAISAIRNLDAVAVLFDEIGPRYEDRPGGYIRIIKLDPRSGDNAPMARVELV